MSSVTSDPACWSWPEPTEFPGAEDSLERWQAVIDWQAGRCAACGRPGPLVEDHDHYTGLVRGWLDRGCNTAEGMAHISGREFWFQYRERNPASIWRLKADYLGTWGTSPISDPDALIALHSGWLTREQIRNGERPTKEQWASRPPINLGL